MTRWWDMKCRIWIYDANRQTQTQHTIMLIIKTFFPVLSPFLFFQYSQRNEISTRDEREKFRSHLAMKNHKKIHKTRAKTHFNAKHKNSFSCYFSTLLDTHNKEQQIISQSTCPRRKVNWSFMRQGTLSSLPPLESHSTSESFRAKHSCQHAPREFATQILI